MALADLITRLEVDVEREVRAIEQRAAAEVRAIGAATAQAIAESTARQIGDHRKARRLIAERELASTQRRHRGEELAARHARFARVLTRAHILIPEVAASPDYRTQLPAHANEALSFVEGLAARLRCPAEFADLLRPLVDRRTATSLVIDESIGPGVIVESTDGSVTVDNTLNARLTRLAHRLIVDLAKEVSDGGR